MGFEKRMGTSLKVSQPPQTMISACPAMILSAAVVMAWFALMQAIVTLNTIHCHTSGSKELTARKRRTVCAGTPTGNPELIAASRAIFEVRASWITVPYST
jgi:hypothetical protein